MASDQRVEAVIADLATRPPAAGSWDAAYEFADDHPDLAVELVLVGLPGLPKGTPFLDDMIRRAPAETLEVVAAEAVRVFTTDQTNKAAESAIEQVALQDPQSLSAFLQALWPVSASIRSYSRDWPWRGAYIAYSGEAMPCCMVATPDRVNFGSMAREGVVRIWNGDAYRHFRARLDSDQPPEVCRGCAVYHGTF